MRRRFAVLVGGLLLACGLAHAMPRVAINPSDQTNPLHPACAVGLARPVERDLALTHAERIKALLLPGVDARIFQDILDDNLANESFVKINNFQAHACVSVHTNGGNGRGPEVLRDEKQNALYGGKPDRLAQRVFGQLLTRLREVDGTVPGTRGVRNGRGENILTRTKMPSVLAEVLFHDNDTDCLVLGSEAGRQAAAAGIAEGVQQYLVDAVAPRLKVFDQATGRLLEDRPEFVRGLGVTAKAWDVETGVAEYALVGPTSESDPFVNKFGLPGSAGEADIFTRQTGTLAEGAYTLCVRDVAGNSTCREFTVERTRPRKAEFINVNPAPSATASTDAAAVTLDLSASDPPSWAGAPASGVDGFRIVWDQSSGTLIAEDQGNLEAVADAADHATHTQHLDDGIWYAHVRVRDRAGNWSLETAHVGPFQIDRTRPQVGVTNTGTGQTVTEVTFDGKVTITVKDSPGGCGIASVKITNTEIGQVLVDEAPGGDKTYVLDVGVGQYLVEVTDCGGRTTRRNVTVGQETPVVLNQPGYFTSAGVGITSNQLTIGSQIQLTRDGFWPGWSTAGTPDSHFHRGPIDFSGLHLSNGSASAFIDAVRSCHLSVILDLTAPIQAAGPGGTPSVTVSVSPIGSVTFTAASPVTSAGSHNVYSRDFDASAPLDAGGGSLILTTNGVQIRQDGGGTGLNAVGLVGTPSSQRFYHSVAIDLGGVDRQVDAVADMNVPTATDPSRPAEAGVTLNTSVGRTVEVIGTLTAGWSGCDAALPSLSNVKIQAWPLGNTRTAGNPTTLQLPPGPTPDVTIRFDQVVRGGDTSYHRDHQHTPKGRMALPLANASTFDTITLETSARLKYGIQLTIPLPAATPEWASLSPAQRLQVVVARETAVGPYEILPTTLANNNASATTTGLGRFVLLVDTAPPTSTLTISGPSVTEGDTVFVGPTSTPRVVADDQADGTGVKAIVVTVDNLPAALGMDGSFTLTPGRHVVRYRSTDQAGNQEAEKTRIFLMDATPPTVRLVTNGLTGEPPYSAGEGLVVATDPGEADGIGAGLAPLHVTVDGVASAAAMSLLPEGPHDVHVVATDRVGNQMVFDQRMIVDLFPPGRPTSVGTNVIPTSTPWTADPLFTVTWENPPGETNIGGFWFKFDNPPTGSEDGMFVGLAGATQVQITPLEGAHFIYIWLVDQAGNSNFLNTGMARTLLDQTAPVLAPTIRAGPRDFTFGVTDPLSGVASYDVVIRDPGGREVRAFHQSGGGLQPVLHWDGRDDQGIPLPEGTYGVTLEASDFVGHRSVRSETLFLDDRPPGARGETFTGASAFTTFSQPTQDVDLATPGTLRLARETFTNVLLVGAGPPEGWLPEGGVQSPRFQWEVGTQARWLRATIRDAGLLLVRTAIGSGPDIGIEAPFRVDVKSGSSGASWPGGAQEITQAPQFIQRPLDRPLEVPLGASLILNLASSITCDFQGQPCTAHAAWWGTDGTGGPGQPPGQFRDPVTGETANNVTAYRLVGDGELYRPFGIYTSAPRDLGGPRTLVRLVATQTVPTGTGIGYRIQSAVTMAGLAGAPRVIVPNDSPVVVSVQRFVQWSAEHLVADSSRLQTPEIRQVQMEFVTRASDLVLAPVAGAVTNARPTFSWNDLEDVVSGTDFFRVRVYAGALAQGTPVQDLVTKTQTVTAPTPLPASGDYTWTVEAVDRAGNSTVVVGPTFTVDADPPTVTGSFVSPSGPVSAGSAQVVQWQATVVDAHPSPTGGALEVSYNSGQTWTRLAGGLASGDGVFTWNVPQNLGVLTNAARLRFQAQDQVGNSSAATALLSAAFPITGKNLTAGSFEWIRDPAIPDQVTLRVRLTNTGNLPIPGPIPVRFTLTGIPVSEDSTSDLSVDLGGAGGSAVIERTFTLVSGTAYSARVEIDPGNTREEITRTDNVTETAVNPVDQEFVLSMGACSIGELFERFDVTVSGVELLRAGQVVAFLPGPLVTVDLVGMHVRQEVTRVLAARVPVGDYDAIRPRVVAVTPLQRTADPLNVIPAPADLLAPVPLALHVPGQSLTEVEVLWNLNDAAILEQSGVAVSQIPPLRETASVHPFPVVTMEALPVGSKVGDVVPVTAHVTNPTAESQTYRVALHADVGVRSDLTDTFLTLPPLGSATTTFHVTWPSRMTQDQLMTLAVTASPHIGPLSQLYLFKDAPRASGTILVRAPDLQPPVVLMVPDQPVNVVGAQAFSGPVTFTLEAVDGRTEALHQDFTTMADGAQPPLWRPLSGVWSVQQGVYQGIAGINEPSFTIRALSVVDHFTDYILQGRVFYAPQDLDATVGLLFRAQEAIPGQITGCYAVRLRIAGQIDLLRFDTSNPLRAVVLGHAVLPQPVDETGVPLTIVVQGSRIRVAPYGIVVIDVLDATYLTGHVGLEASSFEEGGQIGRFDNIRVVDLTNATGTTALTATVASTPQTIVVTGSTATVRLAEEGRHTVQVSAVDGAGNVTPTTTVQVSVDTTPPQSVFTIGSSSDGPRAVPVFAAHPFPLVTSRTALTVTAEDPISTGVHAGVREVRARLLPLGTTVGMFNVTPGPTTVQMLAGPDGDYTLAYFAVDRVANSEGMQLSTVTLDNTVPVALLHAPSPDQTGVAQVVGGMIPVVVTATDAHFATARLEAAPGLNATTGFVPLAVTTQPLAAQAITVWQTAGRSGWQTLRLVAEDLVQNITMSTAAVFVGAPALTQTLGPAVLELTEDRKPESLHHPEAVALGSDGTRWVADTEENRVLAFRPDGTLRLLVGRVDDDLTVATGVAVAALSLKQPGGLAARADGGVAIADTEQHRVVVVSSWGVVQQVIGRVNKEGKPQSGVGPAEFNHPRGVDVDAAGNLYVADTENHRWQVLSATGTPLLSVPLARGPKMDDGDDADGKETGELEEAQPIGIARERTGMRVYVSDRESGQVLIFTLDGGVAPSTAALTGALGGGPGTFKAPWHLAATPQGDLYVAERNANRVRRFDRFGAATLVFGLGPKDVGGQEAAPTRLNKPTGIAGGSSGELAVASRNDDRVKVYDKPAAPVASPPAVAAAPRRPARDLSELGPPHDFAVGPNPAQAGVPVNVYFVTGWSNAETEVRVYTVAGEPVSSTGGEDAAPTRAPPVPMGAPGYAPGRFALALAPRNDAGSPLSSGVYLVQVKVRNPTTGEMAGALKKFLVVR